MIEIFSYCTFRLIVVLHRLPLSSSEEEEEEACTDIGDLEVAESPARRHTHMYVQYAYTRRAQGSATRVRGVLNTEKEKPLSPPFPKVPPKESLPLPLAPCPDDVIT
jgi:hypothetical protein